MRFLLLPGLLAMATRSLAQSSDSTHSVAMSFPLTLSPLASLSVLPLRLSPDDSLQQRAFRRNRVKTVALVRLRGNNPADTVDYTEVDRLGSVLRYRPAHGNSYRQRYGRGHELVERTTYPTTEGFASFSQVLYDPATKTTTTSLGPSLAQLAPWQVARQARHGDTLVVESFFHPTPVMPNSPMRRLVLRTFRTGADTVRSDMVVYDVAEQVIVFESYYRIGSRQHPREGGSVSFDAPAAEPAQMPATARRLLGASLHQHGRYLPNTRSTYNAQGSLVRQFFIPPPHPAKPKTTFSPDKRMQLTIKNVTDTSSVRYVRRADGQLLREEYRIGGSQSPAGEAPPAGLSFTEYTYLPNGLRRTKAGSLAARYEYRYTYY